MQFNARRGLTWSARMLAQSVGVNVVEDPHATTFRMRRDGTFITPVLDEDDPDFSDLINGGAIHEIAHYLKSDFAVLDECSKVERTFLMVFEDLRIERWAQLRWAGAATELKAMWRALYRLGKVSRPDGTNDNVLYAVGTWALAHCRSLAVAVEGCQADAVRGREIVLDKFGPDAVAHVEDVLTHVDALGDSWDALQLARRLLKMFVDPAHVHDAKVDIQHSPEMQDAPDEGQPGQGGQPGQDSTGGPTPPPGEGGRQKADLPTDGSSIAQGDAGGQSEDSADAGDSPGGQMQDAGGDLVVSNPSGDEPSIDIPGFAPMDFDGGELAEVAVEDLVCEASGTRGSAHAVEVACAEAEATSAGEALIATAIQHSLGVREKIRHLLNAATRESEVIGRRGKVMPTKLWKLRGGNANVFRLHVDGVSMSTYVHVLCDASSSMEKARRLTIALQATAALTSALEGIPGLTSAVSAFPNGTVACARLKRVDETTQQAGDKLAGQRAAGGTPMAAAVQAIRGEVLASMADRKIVFIPSDGSPDNKAEAQIAIRDLERHGVEVVMIGIGVSVEGLAEHALRINSVADLAEALFGYLERRFAEVVSKAAA
jgi:hypothetical protein